MALLDALRALTALDPPSSLPACDEGELARVLDAHGLAPMASYQLETRPIGATAPASLRERLLPIYQGVVNDNVFRLVTLKGALREVDVPVVLLGAAALIDWVYPHLAFRPVGDLRLAVGATHAAAFARSLADAGFAAARTGEGGHTMTFDDGRITITIQEGAVLAQGADPGLFERASAFPALGRSVARPAAEDAIVSTVAELAEAGLHAPLVQYLDLRQLLGLPEMADVALSTRVRARAATLHLSRALHGACAVVAHYWPELRDRAAQLQPQLSRAEAAAVDAVVAGVRDPSRLRLTRGAVTAARLLVAP